ncbi:hypothetical protein Tco_0103741 [Tanacetum coccineum]
MADAEHAPTMAPPIRTDEQIMPRIRWVPIGKSNCYLNEEKSQPSPIYKIFVDILKQTNFFRAFTASSTIPAIYIQQFWDTICFESKAGSYKCQLERAIGYPKEVIHLSNVTTNDMFQPWRALTTIINLMWKNFTPSIHNFTEDKKFDLSFHLQRLHNFHPRPESPLHLPTEEPVLGNLKFSAKGTKREVFGMTIPNELINDVIRGSDYYDAYLKKVAKHQRYLAGEEVSEPESPAPKAAKPTKPKSTKQAKPTDPKAATKKPKPAPAKPKEKKRKPVSESLEAPPLAKRAKAGKVVKKRTVKSSKQLVDEFIDEGVPAAKPRLEDIEEEILQKVPGKGKEKVGEEQAAQVLLNLQTPKKKSPAEQYIFQRRSHVPTETSGREDSTSLYCQLGISYKPQPEHMDEGFLATAYPNVQENLKLTTNEQVIPEEPASSTGTLSSLQQLGKDFSFGDQFFNDKPSDAENEEATADTEAESMVSVSIQQDTSVIPPMTSPVIGPVPRPDSPNVHWPLPTTTTTTSATTTTTLPLPPQPQQGPSDPIIIKRMGELEELIANLVEENSSGSTF